MAFPIDDDAFCARLLDADDDVDAQAGYRRFVAQRAQVRPWRRYVAGGALGVAAALVLALFFTPLGTYARSFLTVFEPKQFTPVDVSSIAGKHGLRMELQAFGTVRRESMDVRALPSGRAIDAAVGYHVLTPSYLPADLKARVSYKMSRRVEDAFTFSARKARASEARLGKRLPPVPPALDGTTVTVQFGPMIQQRWNQAPKGDEPALVIAQLPVPVVRSSGATLAQLEHYLLTMPNVSPQLAAQIRAIGDPASTLPVPFRPTKQNAQRVRVQGEPGLAIGDNTGVGAVVIWQAKGMMHFVGGALRADEALKIADGLR
jgi:hypothetical protein